ncbi:transmembrane protein 18 isoform X2 [Ischnura elegans]|nr:transmembrane protein 18 isoform X2 [Ischnura elegans]
MGLIGFHIVITLMTLMTRDYGNFQVVLFFVLLLLVYFSESINEIAARNWSLFSRQQYFDSKGMFISLVFSVPILLNCMIMVANWLWQSSQLMMRVKQVQLRHQIQTNAMQQKQSKASKFQTQKTRQKTE